MPIPRPCRIALTLSLTVGLGGAACSKRSKDSQPTSHGASSGQAAGSAESMPADPSAAASPSDSPAVAATTGTATGGVTPGDPRDVRDSTESYTRHEANPWTTTLEDRVSTFAIDVDTGSYTIFRKKVLAGQPIPPDSVRVEEFVNYFGYSDPAPDDDRPFAIHSEVAASPLPDGRHLLRVALRARDVAPAARKPANLVFLVDVSGSMQEPDKLPLVKQSLRILVESLSDRDRVSLVTYAGSTRVVLPPTRLDHRAEILEAIEALDAGGSTAMGSGLDLAYQQAAMTLTRDSVSRVIVLTDGDTNVGPTTFDEILSIISGRAVEGVTLSTIGFGTGNYKDSLLEQLADKGNGNYFYVDGLAQARRVFRDQLGGTLEVIAQDAKVQVDFDPDVVSRYRLVGYENRDVADDDFRDDRVDGGEIGVGHAVTALYELDLRDGAAGDLAVVRVRAKRPGNAEAGEWSHKVPVAPARRAFDGASADFRFAVAAMAAAEILRASPHAAGWKLADVRELARAAAGGSAERLELVSLLGRVIGEERAAAVAR